MEQQDKEKHSVLTKLSHFFTKRDPPEMHEFWLAIPPHGHEKVYRVALGKLMDARKRKEFRPYLDSLEARTKTGSIGYMDLEVRERYVPQEGNSSSSLSFAPSPVYSLDRQRISVPSVVILYLAVEPRYRGRDYAQLLVQRAEELASQWKAEAVIGESIIHPAMAHIHRKMGYDVNEEETFAVKVLRES